ncbi:hypothetical protein [Rhizobium leguminosarum]|uniref:hypothetical protein n=1 Tax=Rhizobium leguminosarum TaxID=384 RepID=UPI0004B68DA5|nr:hypothetical protein [Rhizobium leguminosarum]
MTMDATGADHHNAEYYVNRAALQGSVLAIPIALHPGEDIRGAVVRAVHANAFLNTEVVPQLARSRSFRSVGALHESADADELRKLVNVLGVDSDAGDVDELLSRERLRGRDWVRFSGMDIRRAHVLNGRRVAPRSLKLNPWLKATWSLRPFDFDLDTMELLLDHCPACNRKLGWSKALGVCFCDKCHLDGDPMLGRVDLRQFPQEIVEVGDVEALAFVASLISPEMQAGQYRLHDDLSELSRSELFHLIVKVAAGLRGLPWRHSLACADIAKGARAILDWPNSFDDLLDLSRPSRHQRGSGVRWIDSLHLDFTFSLSVRTILRQRLDQRLTKRVLDRSTRRTELPPLRNSTKTSAGHMFTLTATPRPPDAAHLALEIMRRSPDCRRWAKQLGLPIPWLVDFHQAGLFPEWSTIKKGKRPEPLECELQTKVMEIASKSVPRGTISLHSTVLSLGHSDGKNWLAVLVAVLNGSIQVFDAGGSAPLLQRLFCGAESAILVRECLHSQPSQSSILTMNQGDVALALGKPRGVVRDLSKHGFIPENPDGHHVSKLRRDWMFLSEILDLARLAGQIESGQIRYSLINSNIAREKAGDVTLWSRSGVTEFLSLPAWWKL